MHILVECSIIGIISAISGMISYKIIYNNTKERPPIFNKILLSFVIGFMIHYIIKKSNLTNMYCKKVCYDDKCFMVCPIDH